MPYFTDSKKEQLAKIAYQQISVTTRDLPQHELHDAIFYVDHGLNHLNSYTYDPEIHATLAAELAVIEYVKSSLNGQSPFTNAQFVSANEHWLKAAAIERYKDYPDSYPDYPKTVQRLRNFQYKRFTEACVTECVTDLSATGDFSGINLNWSQPDGKNYLYTVLRALDECGPFAPIAYSVSGESYLDTTVVEGTTYYYKILSSGKDLAPSNIVSSSSTFDTSTYTPNSNFVKYDWDEDDSNIWEILDVETDLGVNNLTEADADIGTKLKSHLDDSGNRDRFIIYRFPDGNSYNLTSQLDINRHRKRFESAGTTTINISGTNSRFRFGGSTGTPSLLSNDVSAGSTEVVVDDATDFIVGELIVIRQDLDGDTYNSIAGDNNDDPDEGLTEETVESWAAQAWQEIFEVMAINTSTRTITLSHPTDLDYTTSKNAEALRYTATEDVGISGFTITVVDDTTKSPIEFDRALRGYAKNLTITNTAKHGVFVSKSHKIEVSGNYINSAQNYGTGGFGYGVILEDGTSNCYVYNNALENLRHHLLIQSGACRNIIAYNYNVNASIADPTPLTDVAVHGHMAHHNLFEGNIIWFLEVTDFYTRTMENVFFRNIFLGSDTHWKADFRGVYGVWVRRNTNVSLIGNHYATENLAIVYEGSEAIEILNEPGDNDSLLPDSLYLDSKPSFFGNKVYPPFGPNTVESIPAQDLV